MIYESPRFHFRGANATKALTVSLVVLASGCTGVRDVFLSHPDPEAASEVIAVFRPDGPELFGITPLDPPLSLRSSASQSAHLEALTFDRSLEELGLNTGVIKTDRQSKAKLPTPDGVFTIDITGDRDPQWASSVAMSAELAELRLPQLDPCVHFEEHTSDAVLSNPGEPDLPGSPSSFVTTGFSALDADRALLVTFNGRRFIVDRSLCFQEVDPVEVTTIHGATVREGRLWVAREKLAGGRAVVELWRGPYDGALSLVATTSTAEDNLQGFGRLTSVLRVGTEAEDEAFFAGSQGLYHFRMGNFVRVFEGEVVSVAPVGQGVAYAATPEKVIRYDNGSVIEQSPKTGGLSEFVEIQEIQGVGVVAVEKSATTWILADGQWTSHDDTLARADYVHPFRSGFLLMSCSSWMQFDPEIGFCDEYTGFSCSMRNFSTMLGDDLLVVEEDMAVDKRLKLISAQD